MNLGTHIRESLTNLVTAKLRSFLAILGVVVGTGSVVALISSSQLATSHALQQFKALGTNLLALSLQSQQGQSGPSHGGPDLQLSQMPKINAISPEIVESAPYISLYDPMRFAGKQLSGQILGATETFAKIAKVGIARGRFVTKLDGNNFYCVIGAKLAQKVEKLGHDPLYEQILLGKHYFTIVGVAKSWTPNLFIFADINDGAIIPLQTSYLISKDAEINNVLFRLIQKPDLKDVQERLTEKLSLWFPNKKIEFRNPDQIISIVGKQRVTFTWLLGAIGGISLLVGGIGVMNIMLVSVIERRREIGIRMAIGARPMDILKMFLIESVILTVFGGIVGIVFGVLASFLLAFFTGWAFQLFLMPPMLGFAVSALVGILSGYYPALRAAKLDPIQTLQGD